MKDNSIHSTSTRQKLAILVAMLFCLFVSGIEYIPQHQDAIKSEQGSETPQKTFLDVAVDALVPFALQVSETVLYLIYEFFGFEFKVTLPQEISLTFTNQLIEILFERIISTQGP